MRPFVRKVALFLRSGDRSICSGAGACAGRRFAALWGNGDHGRLGMGVLESRWRPSVCPSFSVATDDIPRAIACGGAHTLFLTDEGRVFATGMNDFGQLGMLSGKNYSLEPIEISSIPQKVVQIAAGYRHSAAITVDGELYMWGNNSSGQLGLGRRAENAVLSPVKVDCLNGLSIKMVALGSEHSIAVTDEGETLSWGAGGSGRLGHGHQTNMFGFSRSSSEYTPRLIKEFDGVKVKKVAAGMLHSVCVNEQGSVFTFGEKTMLQLGFGGKKNVTLPSLVDELPSCEAVACGGYHSSVITRDGELYTWGSNENGCLGLGDRDAEQSPRKVEGPLLEQPISEVSCGWKHTAAISGGKIFTWGWGGSHGTFSQDGHSSGGQLGHGNDVDYYEPTEVMLGKNGRVLHVSCGFNHTGAILEYVEDS